MSTLFGDRRGTWTGGRRPEANKSGDHVSLHNQRRGDGGLEAQRPL